MMGKPKSIAGRFLKKFKYFFILFVFLAAVTSGFFWWKWATAAPNVKCKMEDVKCEGKIFVIKKGESLSSVAERLKKDGLIRSSLAFKIFILTQGLTGKIQTGSFQLKSSSSTKEIAYILTHGTSDIWLTFPEGWRREEFSQRLLANLDNFNYQEFLKLTEGLEGELFPDTYLIPRQATPSAVIKILTNNFQKKFSSKLELAAKDSELTKKQVLILASIIEREVRRDEDRPIVAGILIKRWQNNWALQADATIQYEMGSRKCEIGLRSEKCDFWEPVKKTDLEIDSPYNTYKYKGLPPAPIANPGLASIKAVLNSQETDWWFYLSDPTGRIHYAKTAKEHNQNIAQYLK